MIVRNINQGYEIIFQRNHALLAGELARKLKKTFRPPRWTETLSAILEHDDGQTDWGDADWVSEEGKPVDFSERGFDLAQAIKVTQESAYKSSWIQLLVSMHSTSLCKACDDRTDEMSDFIREQEKIQKELIKSHSLRKSEIQSYYRFLRWCDECSLILCKGELETNKPKPLIVGEITTQTSVKISSKSGNYFTVSPWCFQEESFSVTAELYRLNKPSFQSTEELKNEVSKTRPVTKTWTFQKDI